MRPGGGLGTLWGEGGQGEQRPAMTWENHEVSGPGLALQPSPRPQRALTMGVALGWQCPLGTGTLAEEPSVKRGRERAFLISELRDTRSAMTLDHGHFYMSQWRHKTFLRRRAWQALEGRGSSSSVPRSPCPRWDGTEGALTQLSHVLQPVLNKPK